MYAITTSGSRYNIQSPNSFRMGYYWREMGREEHDEKFREAEGKAKCARAHSALGYEMIDCSIMHGKPGMGMLIGRIGCSLRAT